MAKRHFFLLLLLASLVGCATAPVATTESDSNAKSFTPPEGKANLYIAWSGGSMGGARSFKVTIDGKALGEISPGTFQFAVLDPGKHGIEVSSALNTTRISLEAVSGKNHFYEVKSSTGVITARAEVNLVLFEEMGKLMVRQNKQARSMDEYHAR